MNRFIVWLLTTSLVINHMQVVKANLPETYSKEDHHSLQELTPAPRRIYKVADFDNKENNKASKLKLTNIHSALAKETAAAYSAYGGIQQQQQQQQQQSHLNYQPTLQPQQQQVPQQQIPSQNYPTTYPSVQYNVLQTINDGDIDIVYHQSQPVGNHIEATQQEKPSLLAQLKSQQQELSEGYATFLTETPSGSGNQHQTQLQHQPQINPHLLHYQKLQQQQQLYYQQLRQQEQLQQQQHQQQQQQQQLLQQQQQQQLQIQQQQQHQQQQQYQIQQQQQQYQIQQQQSHQYQQVPQQHVQQYQQVPQQQHVQQYQQAPQQQQQQQLPHYTYQHAQQHMPQHHLQYPQQQQQQLQQPQPPHATAAYVTPTPPPSPPPPTRAPMPTTTRATMHPYLHHQQQSQHHQLPPPPPEIVSHDSTGNEASPTQTSAAINPNPKPYQRHPTQQPSQRNKHQEYETASGLKYVPNTKPYNYPRSPASVYGPPRGSKHSKQVIYAPMRFLYDRKLPYSTKTFPYPPSFISLTTTEKPMKYDHGNSNYYSYDHKAAYNKVPDFFVHRTAKSLLDSYIPSWQVIKMLQNFQYPSTPNTNQNTNLETLAMPFRRNSKRNAVDHGEQ